MDAVPTAGCRLVISRHIFLAGRPYPGMNWATNAAEREFLECLHRDAALEAWMAQLRRRTHEVVSLYAPRTTRAAETRDDFHLCYCICIFIHS